MEQALDAGNDAGESRVNGTASALALKMEDDG